MHLGPLRLKNPWLLAPMEAVSDYGFRSLCSRLGASLTFTEMVRGSSFLRQTPGTLALIDTHAPAGVQFSVSDPKTLEELIKLFFALRKTPQFAHLHNVQVIDLNFGCPNPELIRRGMGPALIKRTQRMEALFKTLATIREHDERMAFGVKLRLGLNEKEASLRVVHRLLPAANAHLDYFIVHGRHAHQRSSTPANWQELRAIRDELTIPLIANGGAHTASLARNLLRETRAAGVMIARGAIENPWIFRELTGGSSPTREEILHARDEYMRTAALKKYREFHEKNFERLVQS